MEKEEKNKKCECKDCTCEECKCEENKECTCECCHEEKQEKKHGKHTDNKEVEKLKAELKEANDKCIRIQAEMMNFKW